MESLQTAEPAAQRLSAAALRSFFRIAEAWKLTGEERRRVLGGVAKQTLYNWAARPENTTLTGDQLDRISYLLGIYKSLHILFSRPEQADSWIRRPNDGAPFGHKTAADILFSGRMEDMLLVRRYLDAARSPW